MDAACKSLVATGAMAAAIGEIRVVIVIELDFLAEGMVPDVEPYVTEDLVVRELWSYLAVDNLAMDNDAIEDPVAQEPWSYLAVDNLANHGTLQVAASQATFLVKMDPRVVDSIVYTWPFHQPVLAQALALDLL